MVDVAIVGGGISGLAAAYELQQRAVSARVIESGPRPGGVIVTERFDGWVVDGGPDSLLVQKPVSVISKEIVSRAKRIPGLIKQTLNPPRPASPPPPTQPAAPAAI